MYTYKALCTRVVDGDTVILDVDLGFRMRTEHSFRLIGVDCPEIFRGTDEEKERGKAAREFVRGLLIPDGEHKELTIKTKKADSFGRWLATVLIPKAGGYLDLANEIIKAGHGVPYVKKP